MLLTQVHMGIITVREMIGLIEGIERGTEASPG